LTREIEPETFNISLMGRWMKRDHSSICNLLKGADLRLQTDTHYTAMLADLLADVRAILGARR
jgi:hypothetical protein